MHRVEPTSEHERRITGVAALEQPLRRELYRLVAERGEWTTRDDAAEALDIPRTVAAFHLDKLVDAGVLEVSFMRTSGRSGPGAGRPAKVYRRGPAEVSASIPDRRYDLAASLLADAVADAQRRRVSIDDALRTTARDAGTALGREVTAAGGSLTGDDARRRDALLTVLADQGYEPHLDESGEIAMLNCPFHRLAEQHRELVCGLNLDLLDGLLEGMGSAGLTARLAPEPGYCCVRIRTEADS